MSTDNSYYPKIYFPYKYREILKKEPLKPVLPIEPKCPHEPKNNYEYSEPGCINSSISYLVIFIGVILTVIGTKYNNDDNLFIIWGIVLIILGIIGHFIVKFNNELEEERKIKYKANFDKAKKEYSSKLNEYTNQIVKYKSAYAEYEEATKNFNKNNYILQYRLDELSKYFSKLKIPYNDTSSFFCRRYPELVNALRISFNDNVYFSNETAYFVDTNSKVVITINVESINDIYSGTDNTSDYTSSQYIKIILEESQAKIHQNKVADFIIKLLKDIKSFQPINKENYDIHLVEVWSTERAIFESYKTKGFDKTQELKKKYGLDSQSDDLPF